MLLFLIFPLSGCVSKFTIVEIIDRTKSENLSCVQVLQKFYEDENNEYYFGCEKSDLIIVKYKGGSSESVSDAFKNNHIHISDLDLYNISYYKEPKN